MNLFNKTWGIWIERQKPKEVAAAAPIKKPVVRGGLDADFTQEKLTIGKNFIGPVEAFTRASSNLLDVFAT